METGTSRTVDRTRSVEPPRGWRSVIAIFLRACWKVLVLLLLIWCSGAIWFDGPFPGLGNLALLLAWLALGLRLFLRLRNSATRRRVCLGAALVVILPWLMKRPSNDRDWETGYARTPRALVAGDLVTITDFRNFDYGQGGRVTAHWETRSFHLSHLRGVDLFLNHWGSDYIAHPIFSFDFGAEGYCAFSVETRREKGETFSTFGGLYKLYELIYLVGDERDFVRSRTNYRADEDCYLYRLDIGPEKCRERFMEYVQSLNDLSEHPRFYNVINANCTTAVRSQIQAQERGAFDWRLVLNGKLDEFLAAKGLLKVKDLPVEELKRRGHIDAAAEKADAAPDFSARIREGVPGFEP